MNRSQTDRPLIARKPSEPRTDWLAWSLQFVLGLFVGGIASSVIGPRMIRLHFIGLEEMHLVIAGIALFGGAIASYRGDDTWVTRSALDPERPPPSNKCRTCSIAVGSVGAAIFAYAVICHLSTAGWSGGHSSLSVSEVILLMLGVFLAYLLVRAFRTGTAFWAFGTIDRDQAPFIFWLWVASACLTVLYLLVRLLS